MASPPYGRHPCWPTSNTCRVVGFLNQRVWGLQIILSCSSYQGTKAHGAQATRWQEATRILTSKIGIGYVVDWKSEIGIGYTVDWTSEIEILYPNMTMKFYVDFSVAAERTGGGGDGGILVVFEILMKLESGDRRLPAPQGTPSNTTPLLLPVDSNIDFEVPTEGFGLNPGWPRPVCRSPSAFHFDDGARMGAQMALFEFHGGTNGTGQLPNVSSRQPIIRESMGDDYIQDGEQVAFALPTRSPRLDGHVSSISVYANARKELEKLALEVGFENSKPFQIAGGLMGNLVATR
ncbi:hypothetical protein Vadar_007605 [Vaccinium darrowii]|uniref:Uncharacterized protein n=1 Tax=Vaccinium darrowii TaxID=229202 RepID=A0ACB7XY85_9ERIC|nr:hypothetical protein Vadar_007605 [Vaccinium darrowii]